MPIQSNNIRSHDYDLNYAALAVAIIKNVPTERSFGLLYGKATYRITYTEDDILHMIEEKKNGATYVQIAETFGTSSNAVYCQITRYIKKHTIVCP